MRNYGVRLQEDGISQLRVRELENFCLQYQEKRERLQDLLHSMPRAVYSLAPGRSGPGDPTGKAAVQIATEGLMREIEDIEEAAREAARESGENDAIAGHLLAYVTRRAKPPLDTIPCGRRQFYSMRRRFFRALDRRRWDGGSGLL